MRVNNRNFPYPILNREPIYSTYNHSNFKLNTEIYVKDNKLVFSNTNYYLRDEYIENLIENGFIKVYMVVECSWTIYRKTFEIKSKPENIEIDLGNLDGKVVVSSFGVVEKEIAHFHSDSFSENYVEYSFKLGKNDIVLIDDGFDFPIVYDESEDDKVSSIFDVISDEQRNEGIQVSPAPRKINIYIPKEQFEKYNNMKYNDNLNQIFFSSLLVPSLIHVLKDIQFDAKNSEKYENITDIISEYTWFNSIAKQFKNIKDQELTLTSFKELDIMTFSQELIGFAIDKSIDSVFDLTIGMRDENED